MKLDSFRTFIESYLQNNCWCLAIICNNKGIITQTNEHAQALYSEIIGKQFVELLLIPPNKIDLEALSKNPNKKVRYNLNLQRDLPLTYYFCFSQVEDQFLILADEDFNESEVLRKSVLTLNADLNNMTREMRKKNSELQKTKF